MDGELSTKILIAIPGVKAPVWRARDSLAKPTPPDWNSPENLHWAQCDEEHS